MAKKSQVRGYAKGMLSDPDPRFQVPGTYRYAKNIKLINSDGMTFTVENVNGNTLTVDLYKEIEISGNDANGDPQFNTFIPPAPNIWQTHYSYPPYSTNASAPGNPEYSTSGTPLSFAGNIVGHYSFKNQLFLIVVGYLKGNTEAEIDISVHKNVRWRTMFLMVDFDADGEFMSVKDLGVSYNINIEYPDLNMDPLLSCKVEGIIENDCLTRVYWTDNLNPLRTLQLNRTDLPDIDPSSLDIKPLADFNEPVLTGVVSGRLLAGVYRYAFKYETEDGGETGISSLSDVYHTTRVGGTSYNTFYGSESGVETAQGLQITIHNVDQDFDRITLYAVYYSGLNVAASVLRVGTEKINQSGPNESVTFIHQSTENLIPNGLAEVLIPSNTWDVCKDIAIKDNILFAANLRSIQNVITEKEWNVKIRRARLSDTTASLTTTDSSIKDYTCPAPYDPDNVVEANSPTYYQKLNIGCSIISHRNAHRYIPFDTTPGQDSGFQDANNHQEMLGGASIDYSNNTLGGCRVSFAMQPKSSSTIGNRGKLGAGGNLKYGSGVSINSYNSDVVQLDNIAGSVANNVDTEYQATVTIGGNKDPQAAATRRGYQRGETYRFGVLVYDKAGNPGNVLWIGDIQMPTRHDRYIALNYFDSSNNIINAVDMYKDCNGLVQDYRTSVDIANHIPSWSAFHSGLTQNSTNKRNEVYEPADQGKGNIYTFDLYCVFEFKIPPHVREKISAFQVVRAERKEEDRSIIQQGILKQCCLYDGYAKENNSIEYHLTNSQLAANTAGVQNDWPEYETLLKGYIGINCTNMGIEGNGSVGGGGNHQGALGDAATQGASNDPAIAVFGNTVLRREADVGADQGDFTMNHYFGSFDYGWFKGDTQAYRYQHFVDPTTHVMYSPDSAFGVRPYRNKSGDFLVIDAVLKLSDKVRWLIDETYGSDKFFTRHINFDGTATGGFPDQGWQNTPWNHPDIEYPGFGYNTFASGDAFYFCTLKETDTANNAFVATGIFTEYDTYFNLYIQSFQQGFVTDGLNPHYVSNDNGKNRLGTHTIDIQKYVGGGISGTNQQNAFYSAHVGNANSSQNDQAASAYVYSLANAKEIGDGEIVGTDFFSANSSMSPNAWRYATHYGFSNHSLGFAHLGSGTGIHDGDDHPQSFNSLSAGTASPDFSGNDVNPNTVSQLARGTRGILLSLADPTTSGNAYLNSGCDVHGNKLRNGQHNVRDVAGIIENQYWGTGNMLSNKKGRQLKIPYASLASIVRPNNYQYGGDGKEAIESTIYIACGHIHPLRTNNDYHVSKVFGGDTFVSMYSHQTTTSPDPQNGMAKIEVFPVESFVNTDMRSGLHLQAGDLEEGHDQSAAPFSNDWFYNPVYSQEKNLKRYTSVAEQDCNIINLPYQIAYSQTKVSGEQTDAFRQFPLYNFHDVEALYGKITSLQTFNNEIYFTQEKSFAKLIVNPRTFLSDESTGTSIFTGTGDTVQAHEYYSVEYGTRHAFSVVQSERNLYYVDAIREKILRFDGKKVDALSDLKGIKSEMSKYLTNGRLKIYDYYDDFDRIDKADMPLNFIGIHGAFDFKTRNLYYTILDGMRIDSDDRYAHPTGSGVYENSSGQKCLAINPWDGTLTGGYAERFRLHNTMVYNEEMDAFIGYLSIYPPTWISHNGYIYSTRNRMRFNDWQVIPDSYPNLPYGTTLYFIGDEYINTYGKRTYGTHHMKEGALELWKFGGDQINKNWFYNELQYDTQTDAQVSNHWPNEIPGNRNIYKTIFEVAINDAPLDSKKFDNIQILATANNNNSNYLKINKYLYGEYTDTDNDPATPDVLTQDPIFNFIEFETDYTDLYNLDFRKNVDDGEKALHKYREGSIRLPIRSEDPALKYRQIGTYLVARLHSRTDKKFNIFAITAKFRKSFN